MLAMPPPPPPSAPWRLQHAWRSGSDHLALQACVAELAAAGITLVSAGAGEAADAAKMHGMELAACMARQQPPPLDLGPVARQARWAQRVPRPLQRYMVRGAQWFGIALGLHRCNLAWVHAPLAAVWPGMAAAQGPAWLAALHGLAQGAGPSRGPERPLALGAQPWQIGVLFETLVLSLAGPQAYRSAFVELRADVLGGPAMVAVLDQLGRLRTLVDDEHLGLPWAGQLARVQRGEAALMVMGDWARAAHDGNVVEQVVPGTEAQFVFDIDFIVPLSGSDVAEDHALQAARVLTQPAFQQAFARRKGCLPAWPEAWDGFDPARWRLLSRPEAWLPSFTFDQCCAVATRQALLDVVADHFLHRRDAAASAAALAAAVRT